ncbi:MAG: oligopeptide/dipeptide ABC transporter ATP-binding protein, partial [Streptosporangiaceae bacterium]
PYTRGLLAAIPRMTEGAADDSGPAITGDPPSPLRIPAGCRFRTRCPIAQPRCETEDPVLAAAPGAPGDTVPRGGGPGASGGAVSASASSASSASASSASASSAASASASADAAGAGGGGAAEHLAACHFAFDAGAGGPGAE